MKLASYWHDTAERFVSSEGGVIEGRFDMAVIGGGFTGLSAALHLARRGARVILLEAEYVGFGASGRNGGHLSNGIAHSYAAAKAHLGAEQAAAAYLAFDASVDLIEEIVAREGIDCDFRRSGKLKLASKAGHYDALARNFDLIHTEVDPDTALLTAAEAAEETGSASFHGAILFRRSAMMHVGRYVTGLARAAQRHGAVIREGAAVERLDRRQGRHLIHTTRGSLEAESVLLATDAYTGTAFPWFRRRIIPVGSFLVATRPLTEGELEKTLPADRNCVTSMNIGNYFRLSPDKRLIFGGRARFSASSDHRADAAAGRILKARLGDFFPHHAEVDIDYCWGGLVGMTADRFPRAGVHEGVHYAMGYSGHGAQLSTLMGKTLAGKILGDPDPLPFEGLQWPSVPGYTGKPWFLPFVGLYYTMLDKLR